MDVIERSSNVSFVALAVADFIFCTAYFSTLVVPLKAVSSIDDNEKHLKNVGPIRHCEPPHAHSPGVASRHCRRPPVHQCS